MIVNLRLLHFQNNQLQSLNLKIKTKQIKRNQSSQAQAGVGKRLRSAECPKDS